MKERISLTLAGADFQAGETARLKQVLADVGIVVDTHEQGGHTVLSFTFDEEAISLKLKRNAGRKAQFSEAGYTYGEVVEMRKAVSEAEMLQKLNVSRSTYYRRLKHFAALCEHDQGNQFLLFN
jgi:hypothetical protein